MVNSFIRALCLVAAARCAVATPWKAPSYAAWDEERWPFTELIHESPFEYAQRGEPAAPVEASKTRRGSCDKEVPVGLGQAVTSPSDTPAAFTAYAPFASNATTFAKNSSFVSATNNTNAAYEYGGTPNPNTFLGWMNQATYSPWSCEQACNALNATGVKCNTFNTFFLRSPTLSPAAACPNPTSMTTIVCALWKNKLYWWDGINTGELRTNFTVVVAGSNLYQRNNSDPL